MVALFELRAGQAEGDAMSWRAEKTVKGWLVTNGEVVFRPDQYGYAKSCSYKIDGYKGLKWLHLITAAGVNAMCMVQPHAGRYGHIYSQRRQQLCLAYAAMMDRIAP